MRAFVICAAVILSGCVQPTSDETASPSPTDSSPATAECAAKSFRAADVNATITTSRGAIDVVLYGAQSPRNVCNFLLYVESDFYDGTIWHRICPHVIQAGGYNPYTMMQKPTREPVRHEAEESKLRNYQGTLGMARSENPDSATSHFYINNRNNNYLDYDGQLKPGYAVFGNVTTGWDVVVDIAQTQTIPDDPTGQVGGCNGIPAPTEQTTITDIRVSD